MSGSSPPPIATCNWPLTKARSDRTCFIDWPFFPLIRLLRERNYDIPLLVGYLVEPFASRAGKRFRHIAKWTLDVFQEYDWPGNIRGLQNVIERAVILCEGDTLFIDETWLQRCLNVPRNKAYPWNCRLIIANGRSSKRH